MLGVIVTILCIVNVLILYILVFVSSVKVKVRYKTIQFVERSSYTCFFLLCVVKGTAQPDEHQSRNYHTIKTLFMHHLS